MNEPLLGLDLKNFQSFTDTEINLDPGLNVIVGASNLGKSAAIRALKAMVYNAPATGLVREKAKEFHTKAWFADGQKIELIKGKGKSEFYWNDAVYAKSGASASDVPAIIREHWNIATPDGRKLCFASQHEPPFLLAEPASAVAKVLGDLTNASMLMQAVGEANKERQSATNDAKARTREAEEARDEILTHAGLTTRGKALEAAREAYSAAQAVQNHHDVLVQIRDTFNNFEQERRELTQLTESTVNLDALVADMNDALASLKTLQEIDKEHGKLLEEQRWARKNISEYHNSIDRTEKQIETLLKDAGVCPLCGSKTC